MTPMVLLDILQQQSMTRPDGRLLHAYMVSDDQFAAMQAILQRLPQSQRRQGGVAGVYVLWAAERIRRHYDGSGLTWDFLNADLPGIFEGTTSGSVVRQGLEFWQRKLHRGLTGSRLFLYTLLTEGGIPLAVLEGARHHAQALRQMIEEICSRGGEAVLGQETAFALAQQKMRYLPRVLQNPDSVALFVGLAQAIFDLRDAIPAGLAPNQIEGWLNRERPQWQRDLPLRVTPQIIENIIHPALASARVRERANGHPAQREIHVDSEGHLHPVAVLLPEATLPMAGVLANPAHLLRLLPRFNPRRPLAYRALRSADSPSREIERVGGTGPEIVPLSLFQSLEFDVMSDTVSLGTWSALSALPAPEDSITLWAGQDSAGQSLRLRALSGGRTRASAIWACIPSGAQIELGAGLVQQGRHPIDGAEMVRLTGQGVLQVGGQTLRIGTGADADTEPAALYFFGKTLPNWRLPNGEPVYLGSPAVYGQRGDAAMIVVPAAQLRRGARQGGSYGADFCAWALGAEHLALARAICLPAGLTIDAQESIEGGLTLRLDGLPEGIMMDLRAGSQVASGRVGQTLVLPSRLPETAFVTLILTEIGTGRSLTLTAPWPSRMPQFIRDDAVLPHRDIDVSFDDLPGLSYLAPDARTRLDIEVAAGRSFSLPVSGLVPLTRLDAVLRKLLLRGTADNIVAISLHNAAGQTGRINLRRYHGQMVLHGDTLTLGLDADLARGATFAPVQGPGQVRLHLTQIETGEVQELVVTLDREPLNLRAATGIETGLWLVQGRFDGRHQRPVAWLATAPDEVRPIPKKSRPSRIQAYRANLIAKGKAGDTDRDWTHLLHLLLAVRDGGDPAMLDQFHALAEAPAALARMLFCLPAHDLNAFFSLDRYWSLFWPALPLADLVMVARDMLDFMANSMIVAGIAPSKAQPMARSNVIARLALLRDLRPDLSGNLALVLVETGLILDVASDKRFDGLLFARPQQALDEAVQTIARSDPALPGGIEGVMPKVLTMPERGFQRSVAMTVGTVLSVAEHVLGLRSPLTAAQMLDANLIESSAPDLFGRALHRALLVAYSNQRT